MTISYEFRSQFGEDIREIEFLILNINGDSFLTSFCKNPFHVRPFVEYIRPSCRSISEYLSEALTIHVKKRIISHFFLISENEARILKHLHNIISVNNERIEAQPVHNIHGFHHV